MSKTKTILYIAAILVSADQPAIAAAAAPGDRVDPSLAREQVHAEEAPRIRAAPELPTRSNPAQAPNTASLVTIGAIRVEGASVVPASAFASIIQPYLGRMLSTGDLSQLATEIAGVLREAGYGLATATIPRQRLDNGVLRVTVDEGRIDAVDAGGDRAVERVLSVLANGEPVRTDKLERQLLLAEDLAGATLAQPTIVRRDGHNVLTVKVRRDRINGRASVDNWGSSSSGPMRATLSVDINAVFADDDQLTVGAVVTPLQPREFQYVEASYSKPLNSNGTAAEISGYYSHSRSRGDTGRLYQGSSQQAEAGLSHAITRSRRFSAWVSGDLALMDSALSRNGQPVRSDRIATATLTLNASARSKSSWIRGRIAFIQGVDALGSTKAGDPLASRRDASGSFSKTEFYASFGTELAPHFGLGVSVGGQLAAQPLLVSEEIGLGGRTFLRAFDYREVSGDEGAAAALELRYDLADLPGPFRRAQLYAFADAGRVTNLEGGFGGGDLASAGGGVRAWLRGGFEGSLELGVPLTDSPFDPDPSPRVSFTLSKSFQGK
jgi:hemolysin activation/secretion protein